MRSIIPTAAARSRSMMVAVVLGTAITAGPSRTSATPDRDAKLAAQQEATPDAIHDITRYCQACWRNARLPIDQWDDCTQQVFARLLERLEISTWHRVLTEETNERREFVRAIDTVKKRVQRARKYSELSTDVSDDHSDTYDPIREQREAVDQAAMVVLSPRQKAIVDLSADGWAVPDIAKELQTTPERVSDEKYKAIRKLRSHLGIDLELEA